MKADSLRTPLAKARGLGAAKSGFNHWWMQRLSALALIPLCVWFLYQIMSHLVHADRFSVGLWLENPLNALLISLMLVALFWHARLGIQAVVEDYVHRECTKITILILNSFFFLTLIAMSLLAVFKLHFFGI
jgi:succinate dehydrogenase / fumarate reductase membrane anchor subunit